MLTYSDLEKAFRQERSATTLQKLTPEFYKEARALAESPEAGGFRESILEYLRKTYTLRANKIIHYAGRSGPDDKPPENILPSELGLYAELMKAVADGRAAIFDSKLDLPPPAPAAKPPSKVRILQALPAIAASDGKDYGPFKVDDVVELPPDLAAVLVRQGVAAVEEAAGTAQPPEDDAQ
jgi:DNA replication initiation complex subunit (GINS family)